MVTDTIIKKGYKQTELGVIPEDWDILSLGEIIKLQGGYSFQSKKFSKQGIPVIRISDIQNGLVDIDKAICHPQINIPDEFKIQKNDILVAMSGATTGKVGIYNKNILSYQNQRVGRFVVKNKNKISQTFMGQLVSSPLFQIRLGGLLEQGAQPNISGNQIESLVFVVPSRKDEQTAIAAVLSDTDALIEKLENLIEKKKNIKQGAMQELLTGKKRLPGFSGEWEAKKLGEVCDINKGIQKGRAKLTDVGKYPVWNGGIEPSGYAEVWNMNGNTITISEGGNSCGFVNYCTQKFWLGGHCYAIQNIKNNFDQTFLYQKLKYNEVAIMSLRVGSGLPNIQKKNLLNLDFSFPSDKQEQTAIATNLSDMDAEIESLEQERNKYTVLKQGMMQQLLTGKIRIYGNK